MTHKIKSLVEALTPRACVVAELLASRLPEAGLWAGYKASEGLDGELRFDDLLSFQRPGQPRAVLVFRNPEIVDATDVDWGHAEVRRNNKEIFGSKITLDKPLTYTETIRHQWSKTVSLMQQVTAGLEAGIKVGAEAGSQGGIHGITAKVYAEITAKITASYLRKWGEDSTETDTIERVVTIEGPATIEYEAIRSINSLARTIRTSCDYSHSVELIDERMGIAPDNRPALQLVSGTWTEFKAVLQGFAPANRQTEWGPQPTAFYHEFIGNPLRGDAFDAVTKPIDAVVEIIAEYQRVVSQDIKII